MATSEERAGLRGDAFTCRCRGILAGRSHDRISELGQDGPAVALGLVGDNQQNLNFKTSWPVMDHRAFARKLANESLSQGKPLEWFELLYGAAADAPAAIPWADQRVNPNLHEWLQRSSIARRDATALVVGCGLGDDAEFLQGHGFVTTAFDVAPSAIAWCQQRFPDSAVKYCVADLFDPPREWFNSFDLVVEIYTLQVLPAELRRQAMESMAPWVRPCGRLLVITRGRDESDDPGQMPWPLLRQELNRLVDCGLTLAQFDDYFDDEDPPVRRFRCEFRR